MIKKRDILPVLHSAIRALTDMSADAAKLELSDNDQASRRLKRDIVNFKKNELSNLTNTVISVRTEINMIPPKKRSKVPVNTEEIDKGDNF